MHDGLNKLMERRGRRKRRATRAMRTQLEKEREQIVEELRAARARMKVTLRGLGMEWWEELVLWEEICRTLRRIGGRENKTQTAPL